MVAGYISCLSLNLICPVMKSRHGFPWQGHRPSPIKSGQGIKSRDAMAILIDQYDFYGFE